MAQEGVLPIHGNANFTREEGEEGSLRRKAISRILVISVEMSRGRALCRMALLAHFPIHSEQREDQR